MAKPNLADTPLSCKIDRQQLVIRIGISTLAFALREKEKNERCPEDDSPQIKKIYKREFAKDVVHEINRGREDGATPLIDFLDEMMQRALDEGTLGVVYDNEYDTK